MLITGTTLIVCQWNSSPNDYQLFTALKQNHGGHNINTIAMC